MIEVSHVSKDEPVFLRSLERADVERTHRWHNDPELFSDLINLFRYVSSSAEAEWIERKVAYSPNEVNLAICERETGTHIGNLYLYEIDWIARTARIGVFIGESAERGKGYGRSAIRQIITYAFDGMNLRRVYLSVLADNTRARKVYEKCGFLVEGCLRRHVYKEGCYQDVVLMACMKDSTSPEPRD